MGLAGRIHYIKGVVLCYRSLALMDYQKKYLILCVSLIASKFVWGETVCPRLEFSSDLSRSLSENEKAFVCEKQDKTGAWSKIPLYQKKLHLRRMLQDRGFHDPSFETKKETLIVSPGEKTRLKSVKYRYSEDELNLQTPWNLLGKPLTPSLLNELETSLSAELAQMGYPCSKASASVPAPKSGDVLMDISTGRYTRFSTVPVTVSPNLRKFFSEPLLSRYYAFTEKERFDELTLRLTSIRMENSGLVNASYFSPQCQRGKLDSLELHGSVSKPRLFRVGVGIDTEGLIKGRISWEHSRLGSQASSLSVGAEGSKLLQEIALNLKWYLFPSFPRFFLSPSLRASRRSEKHFEDYTIKADIFPSTTIEFSRGQLALSAGPSFELVRTVRGPNQGDLFLPILEGKLSFVSHDLEYGITNPIEGYTFSLEVGHTDTAFGSGLTATRLNLFAKRLWNVGNFSPSRYIIGIRSGYRTTLHSTGSLPASFRYYLGGAANLRGFSRLELPRNGLGALSALYFSLENRFPSLLPWDLEPIVFFDAGMIGLNALQLSMPICVSPGIGLRWDSPIGVFRTTFARGLAIGSADPTVHANLHWQLFVGYGEEF